MLRYQIMRAFAFWSFPHPSIRIMTRRAPLVCAVLSCLFHVLFVGQVGAFPDWSATVGWSVAWAFASFLALAIVSLSEAEYLDYMMVGECPIIMDIGRGEFIAQPSWRRFMCHLLAHVMAMSLVLFFLAGAWVEWTSLWPVVDGSAMQMAIAGLFGGAMTFCVISVLSCSLFAVYMFIEGIKRTDVAGEAERKVGRETEVDE